MDKEISQPLNEVFNTHFEETYKDLYLDLKSSLFEPNGKKLSVRVSQFKSTLYEKIQLFSAKRISSNGLMPDVYTEALFQEYKYRIKEYEEPIIDYFISEHLEAIKEKYRSVELAIPENIDLNEEITVELIAEWQAAVQLLERLHMVKDSFIVEEILEFVAYENLGDGNMIVDFKDEAIPITIGDSDQVKRFKRNFTMMRQMIAFKYLIKHIEIKSAGADITKFAEFARFMTGRDLGATNIKNANVYKFFSMPLRKLTKSQVRDFEYVIAYFQDLGMTKIVAEMQAEIDKAKQKSENIG